MSTTPKALAPCKNHLVLAMQIEPLEPLFAYYLRRFVLDFIGDKKLTSDQEVKAFLPTFFDKVDPAKLGLTLDKVKDLQKMNVFADNIFAKAQKAVDEGRATIEDSKNFLNARVYYQTICHFQGRKNEQIEKLIKHAGQMAAVIHKKCKSSQPSMSDDDLLAEAGMGDGAAPTPSSSSFPPPVNPVQSLPPPFSMGGSPAVPSSTTFVPHSTSLPPSTSVPYSSVPSYSPPPSFNQSSYGAPTQPQTFGMPPTASTSGGSSFNPSSIEQSQKKSELVKTLRYAISSLEYNDINAAKKYIAQAHVDVQAL
ncbi:Vacuolar protein sorting-associated protein 1 (Vti1) [Monocercomonoides exilis]|uniref:Vacuolar protein sorting-associated protein 1 (Vti1) n=1 Tax=Monocercomonoides exilis TaxID=2049356 RepID=UPI00355A9094|nr:Vacuolar protein sorting-associated protein 1 (Vti1) [Monocercomonoides exilis]|eukprot:MONOS_11238.1-p1 / transcript=MONOS_11238.1 / gene=MONOS_11238 / organism=Monocercomonoides_exilis_PA203 / gene_product= Vacuolar protein sorting-associated protein 1 (Vti1) / transcript_product= Vacuolar protein sorting-associated protein 1 (Vti1) / location=Mono_scaffold00553:15313-16435(-) / protein_length=309 / sequence_SO=supercontig / SO=protein_coding / is_pseudo=false